MEDIKRKVMQEILPQARYILESSLRNLPAPDRAFDLHKVDYVIDNIDCRLKLITEEIVGLAIKSLTPKLEKMAEEQVRDKIRRSI